MPVHVARQSRAGDPAWTVSPASLEDLVLAYLSQAAAVAGRQQAMEVTR